MKKKKLEKSGAIYEIHNYFWMAIIFAGGCQKTYVAVEAEKAKLSGAELREVSKAERLGEELYLQDTVAAKASNMLLQVAGPIKPGELSGWIIVKDGAKTLTRFIKQTGEDINVIYDVRIDAKGNAEVTKDNLRPLSKTEIAMFRARQNAIACRAEGLHPGLQHRRDKRHRLQTAGWCISSPRPTGM